MPILPRLLCLFAVGTLIAASSANGQSSVIRFPALPPATKTTATHQLTAFEFDDAAVGEDLSDASAELSAALKRLSVVENTLAKQKAADAKEKADKAKKPSFRIGGRIHLDTWNFMGNSPGIGFFENSDPTEASFGVDPEDRFVFRRIRLEMRGNVFQAMQYKIDVDFNNPGRPEYKDVYIGWTELPYNQTLRLGNQKRPIGLDHLNSSRYNVFAERPMVVETFNEDARRMGLLMLGHTDNQSRFWQYGVYNLENTARDGRYIGDSRQLSGNLRLGGSPWYDETSNGRGYFHWAVSGMFAKPDGDANAAVENANEARFRTRPEARSDSRWLNTGRIANAQAYETVGLEAMVNVGALHITSEYQANWTQRNGANDLFFHGAYVQASYFLTGEHISYDRKLGIIGRVKPHENFFLVDRCRGGHGYGMGAWQIAARASYLDLTDEDIEGGVGRALTLGLNWHWTSHSKVQTNYSYGLIDQHAAVGGFTSGYYHLLGTRFMVDF